MTIADVNIIPLGTRTPSVSEYAARACRVLQEDKNIRHELTSMGAIIEGDLKDALRVIQTMHETTFDKDILRVATTVKIDDRRDRTLSMKGKLESVLQKLER